MLNPIKQSNIIRTAFIALFVLTYVCLNISLTPFAVNLFNYSDAIYFVLALVLNLGIAYEISEWLLAGLVKTQDLPKLLSLTHTPTVAVLYLTCDDFNSTLVSRLRDLTYPSHTVFILDDSTQTEQTATINKCSFEVIRRVSKENYKAGNINHWLSNYADRFDYFVILDNDSLIDNNFIDEMICYAEHPDNHNVAIFQSTIEIWNKQNTFARILGLARSLHSYVSDRIDNPCSTTFPTTNNLVRMSAIRAIGGFSLKAPIIEDWATGLDLMEKGFACQKVAVQSFVSTSTNVQMHTKRMVRWACGLLELAKAGRRNLPLTTNLRVYMGIYFYLIWPIYIATLLIATIWGFSADGWIITSLVSYWVEGDINTIYLQLFPSLVFAMCYVIYFFLRPIIAYKTGIRLMDYLRFIFLITAIGVYTFIPLICSQLKVLMGKQHQREMVNYETLEVPLPVIFKEMKLSIVIIILLVRGIVRNPEVFIINFPWLIPIFISPIILYLWQYPSSSQNKHFQSNFKI